MGNCSLFINNTTIIVKNGFTKLACELIEKMKFKEEGDVIRYTLDVMSNLASHSDDINRKNTEIMLKDGSIDLIVEYFI